jgi:vanillate O-demethylase monooxygenase subunit
MAFLKNRWYMAAWSDEVTEKPLGRRICDNEITLYRQKSGEVAAVSSRCPHRFAPMHYGDVVGDNIRCRYHGLLFGADGKCVENPDGSAPPKIALKSYAAREDTGAIWVWIGEGEPTEDLPSIVQYANAPPYDAMVSGYLHVKCNYKMLMDNLVDHSHATHLHEMLRSESAIQHSKGTVLEEDGAIILKNFNPDGPPSPFSRALYPTDGNVDAFVDHKWEAPSFVTIDAGITSVGGDFDDGARTCSIHLIIPETENTSHYFWGISRSVFLDNEELSEKMRQGLQHIFTTEDAWMLEGQQQMMEGEDYWDLKPAMLPQDKATVMVRRRIDKLLADQEAAEA